MGNSLRSEYGVLLAEGSRWAGGVDASLAYQIGGDDKDVNAIVAAEAKEAPASKIGVTAILNYSAGEIAGNHGCGATG